jgi:hypothetical protein
VSLNDAETLLSTLGSTKITSQTLEKYRVTQTNPEIARSARFFSSLLDCFKNLDESVLDETLSWLLEQNFVSIFTFEGNDLYLPVEFEDPRGVFTKYSCLLCKEQNATYTALFVPSEADRKILPGIAMEIAYRFCTACHELPDRYESATARILVDFITKSTAKEFIRKTAETALLTKPIKSTEMTDMTEMTLEVC